MVAPSTASSSTCVVLVNFRTPADVARLVLAILDDHSQGVDSAVVVDNSPEHSSSYPEFCALDQDDRIVVVSSERNLGFGGGVNTGIEHAPIRSCYWILNPDAEPEQYAGRRLAREANPGVAAVGSLILGPDGRVESAGGSWLAALGIPRHRRQGKPLVPQASTAVRVPWVHGASFVVRRDAWRALGGLEDRFFLYYEETEYCFRARRRGYRVLLAPDSRVVHVGGVSLAAEDETNARRRDIYLARNYVLFLTSTVPLWLGLPVVFVSTAVKVIVRLMKRQGARARAHVLGTLWGLRRTSSQRYGPILREPEPTRPRSE